MKLVHYYLPGEGGVWGLMEFEQVHPLVTDRASGGAFLSSLLQWPDPVPGLVEAYAGVLHREPVAFEELAAAEPGPAKPHLLPPIDLQEVWGAGVTYERSKVARMEESRAAARFYDLVYEAERPELFLKATAPRVCGPNAPVRVRADSEWSVPEPELALLISPAGKIVGYTIGNDMSARDVEGENPLYLPQAKIYRQSCALGPAILLETEERPHRPFEIRMTIERGGAVVFSGETDTVRMRRHFADLADWLMRDNAFPSGVFLLTGTGIIPEESFTLEPGDRIRIEVPEIGVLENRVVREGT